jgi:hypothetical protein
MNTYKSMYIYINIYIYIYVFVYLYTYIYTHLYMERMTSPGVASPEDKNDLFILKYIIEYTYI